MQLIPISSHPVAGDSGYCHCRHATPHILGIELSATMEFACFSFHVGFLFVNFSSFKPDTENNANLTLTIADYFQRTSENILILRRVLRPRRIFDIYDLFAPFINLLTYLLY